MSAFACQPGVGSEPSVGWHWALEAARFCEVWVVTHSSHQHAIESWLARHPTRYLHFEYVETPAWTTATGVAAMGLRAQYLAWQFVALRRARRLHSTVGFDLGHHVTYCSIRYPSFLAFMGIPYIWGPVGGGDTVPEPYVRTWARSDRLLERTRTLNTRAVQFDPLVRRTASNAAHIIAVTHASKRALPRSVWDRTTIAAAIATEPAGSVADSGSAMAGQFMYAGRLEPIKGLDLALKAFAEARQSCPGITLTIVGDGPSRRDLEEQAHQLGLGDSVTFTGKVPHEDVATLLAGHGAFLFPALRDSGGFAALEAMAAGLPVICLDLAGPSLAVTESSGIRVAAPDPTTAVAGLAKAIVELAGSSDLRRDMGRAAHERVRAAYSWESKGHLMQTIYSNVLELRGRATS